MHRRLIAPPGKEWIVVVFGDLPADEGTVYFYDTEAAARTFAEAVIGDCTALVARIVAESAEETRSAR